MARFIADEPLDRLGRVLMDDRGWRNLPGAEEFLKVFSPIEESPQDDGNYMVTFRSALFAMVPADAPPLYRVMVTAHMHNETRAYTYEVERVAG